MGEIRFEGEGNMIHNHDFIEQYLNPALSKLSDIQLYKERPKRFFSDEIGVGLEAEKTNMPIKRVDLRALIDKLTDEASKIMQIDGKFYNLEEKFDNYGEKWIVAQNSKPIFRIDFRSWANSNRFEMTDYKKETSLEHHLDYTDAHHGKPWHVSMKFGGPDDFIRELYEGLLNAYKTSERTKILV